ncbi:MAG: AAA family ATPase [Syntrophales bacterium]|nr:AAA family ATPase [Syntrophales bacterium]
MIDFKVMEIKPLPEHIDFNTQFRRALDLMENSTKSVFVTGKAGTGKSTLLTYFRSITKKELVVLAPTGVAAVNVGGQTIHSFFQFKPHVTPDSIKKRKNGDQNIYRRLQTIVIDEISMVRADLLDCIDRFLRINGPQEGYPFGGIQIILFGDLYQLPPVVTENEKEIFKGHYETPYFFGARVFPELTMEFVELEKVYRQTDTEFLRLLNAIRNRTVTEEDLEIINRRVDADFQPKEWDYYVNLTSTNDLADRINEDGLSRLKGDLWRSWGVVKGQFAADSLPTAVELKLKKGAQVMLLSNDSSRRWVNGTMGKVENFENGGVIVSLETGRVVEVGLYTWEMLRFTLEEGRLTSRAIGSFTQYPLRLAYAITIHKSQGKTFNKVIIDVGRGTFAHGQVYVALSRCTKLEGIVLKRPLKMDDILMDWQIVKFLTNYQYRLAAQRCPREERMRLIEEAMKKGYILEIVYLKSKDEKSRRRVKPIYLGEMEFNGHVFMGLEAFCLLRGKKRTFNVDHILEIRVFRSDFQDTVTAPDRSTGQ